MLITDARPSPERELRGREVRYVVMMGVRALCLVVAAGLVSLRVPLLWLWVSICLAGMVLLPWLAVLLANDGPPKPEHRLIRRPTAAVPRGPVAIEAVDGGRRRPTVIDAEP